MRRGMGWVGAAVLSAGLAVSGLAAPSRAAAQAQGDEDGGAMDREEARARELFELGRRQYDLGQFRQAADSFQESYDLSQRPALLMNVYLSYRDAAEPALAARALAEYLELAEVETDERQRLQVRLEALERQAAQAAQEAQAAASASDRAPPPADDGDGTSSSGPDLTGPVVVLAAGGAVLLAAVGTGAATVAENGALEDACPNRVCAPDEAGRIDTVEALSVTTDVLLVVGAAAAAAGAVWLIVAASEGSPDEPTARLTPACGATGCVARLEGTW